MVADASGPLSYPASRGSSNTLTDAELRYANIERELLYVAIVYCCEWFQTNFWDQSFHKSLEAIQLNHLTAPPPPTPSSMLLFLQLYDVTIKYWLGKDMRIADASSRLWPDE